MARQYIPRRAMLIYAHPDDIEFGVAGTAAFWARNGSEVTYIVLTDGNVGSHEDDMTREELAMVRRKEQEAAAEIAGAARCLFLGHNDGLLVPSLELRKELVRLIRTFRPNALVCGDPTNFFPNNSRINHPDHRAAATAALDAVFPACEMNLLYPDLYLEGLRGHKVNYVYVSGPAGEPNFYVDITETIDVKIEALRQHVSQLDGWDPEERLKEWSLSIGARVGLGHAEAFRRLTLKEPGEEDHAPEPDA